MDLLARVCFNSKVSISVALQLISWINFKVAIDGWDVTMEGCMDGCDGRELTAQSLKRLERMIKTRAEVHILHVNP